MYVRHPLIREETVEARLYQEVIVGSASKANTLVVAPTALGKTVIAIMLAAHRLERFPGSKILMVSTTRPLVNQHAASFRAFLNLDGGEVSTFTGHTAPEERLELWAKSRVICATPQVVENDLISGRYPLSDVSLLVFDEAHRATGDYPYAFIAQGYLKAATNPLVLALTASPGGDEAKIKEVCQALAIENIEVRTERDRDVRSYIKGIEIEWVRVDLPEPFLNIKRNLERVMKDRLSSLKGLGLLPSSDVRIPKRDLLVLRERLQGEVAKEPNPDFYMGLKAVAAAITLSHATELLETQGLETLRRYFEKLQRATSKATRQLLTEKEFIRAVRLTENLAQEMHHPKLEALAGIAAREGGGRMIVFSQYRDSAQKTVERLNTLEGVKAVRFVGQSTREDDKGLSQKEQLEILEKFRQGDYNVLVATSVAEEGLDIPKVDLVVFYEPIPSEIRSIQRRGRTGRSRAGRVVVLIARGTRDEAFYWSGVRKEKRMREVLEGLKRGLAKPEKAEGQKRLQEFEAPEMELSIIVDSRELSSSVARELLGHGVLSKPQRLEVGDYILSDRVGVERKTVEDFLQSVIDGRLMAQIKALKESFPRPILLLEGEGLYSKRDIHPNAVRGALAAVAIDFGVPVLWTRDEKETAAILALIAKREAGEGREPRVRGEKRAVSLEEVQEFIVAGLPNINVTLARRLLEEFGSPQGVFGAKEEELVKVKGIGEKTAAEIRRVLEGKYGER
ncbi:MAG: DEAD/DEAH box helicase [Candidatus Hydrothermarchaeota archaeon]